ncbi:hypothetical protein MLD38_019896 [Melastoma candidum]|uniref:Uncharacterized protein n=1 Tax=Melastoma candidum TaxID=119954 RepID=A0ACB9QBI1_9MYRT|nr:hypothetical protein MLD38_019896 [Melastoma candidum]
MRLILSAGSNPEALGLRNLDFARECLVGGMMEVCGKSAAAGHANIIYLSTILGRDGPGLGHKCNRNCENEHVCGNIYRCKLTGLTHICDKNCDQRILYDNHSSFCLASGKLFPLTMSEEQAVRGARRRLDAENSSTDSCAFKRRRDTQFHPSPFESLDNSFMYRGIVDDGISWIVYLFKTWLLLPSLRLPWGKGQKTRTFMMSTGWMDAIYPSLRCHRVLTANAMWLDALQTSISGSDLMATIYLLMVIGGDDGNKTGGVVACKSACEAFGLDQYCFSGELAKLMTCWPSFYSAIFKRACPSAYSYAFNREMSTFTCKAFDYGNVFCPDMDGVKGQDGALSPLQITSHEWAVQMVSGVS